MALSMPSSPKHSHDNSTCSPEFEFWGISDTNNISNFPSVDLPSADELFSDGILLPLQNLNLSSNSSNKVNPNSPNSLLDPCNSFSSSSASPGPASKRWKDIFAKASERERKKDQKTRLGVGNNAELNINIWPFSRSRSAGNASRARLAASRNTSSAPCSRSNSRNEESLGQDGSAVEQTSSMIQRWVQTGKLGPTVGIRVGRSGRSGPIWQLKRYKQQMQQQKEETMQQQKPTEAKEEDQSGTGNEIKGIINLNVNTCIGYRNKSGCSKSGGGSSNNGGMFSIKAIFSKKVY